MITPSRGLISTSYSSFLLTPRMCCFLLSKRNIFLAEHDQKRWPRILYEAGCIEEAKGENKCASIVIVKGRGIFCCDCTGSVPLSFYFYWNFPEKAAGQITKTFFSMRISALLKIFHRVKTSAEFCANRMFIGTLWSCICWFYFTSRYCSKTSLKYFCF